MMPQSGFGKDADFVRSVGERTLGWQQGAFYWGDAIAYDGLLALDDRVEAGWSATLAARFERWFTLAPDSWDDALAPGSAAASLVVAGKLDERVLLRIVTAMTRLPMAGGVPLLRPHVPGWRTLVWVDSLYHLPTTLAAAGVVLDRPELVSQGIDIAAATLDLLSVEPTVGHAYDTGLRAGTGIQWTRGIGWAMLGLLDLIHLAPEAARAAGLDGAAESLLTALAGAQRGTGHWPSVLGGATDGPDRPDDEVSVAGFFVAAARHPARTGDRYDTETAAALAGLVSATTGDGTVTGVSHDTHVTWSVQDYLHPKTLASPWAQGAMLRALAVSGELDREAS